MYVRMYEPLQLAKVCTKDRIQEYLGLLTKHKEHRVIVNYYDQLLLI